MEGVRYNVQDANQLGQHPLFCHHVQCGQPPPITEPAFLTSLLASLALKHGSRKDCTGYHRLREYLQHLVANVKPDEPLQEVELALAFLESLCSHPTIT